MKAHTTETDIAVETEPVPGEAQSELATLVRQPGDGHVSTNVVALSGENADASGSNADDVVSLLTAARETDVAGGSNVINVTTVTAPNLTLESKRKPDLWARLASAIPSMGLDDRAGRVLLSILLAFLLWFYVVNLENPSQTTVFNDLTVDVRGLGAGLKLVNSVSPVDVTVQAPQNALSVLRPADIRPYLDLTNLQAGVQTVQMQAEVRNAQAGGVSVTLNPNSAQVQLEIESSRDFPVQVQVIGTPAFGYGVDAAQADPGTVRITGAEDLVSRVTKVVASVDVDEKAGTQRGSRQPVALDENGNVVAGVTFEPAQIQVVVPVKLLLNYKVVGVRADTRGQPAPGYRVSAITTDPNTVTICCSPTVLNNIQFLDTLPVSISGATFNVITRTELLLPPDVELYPGQTKTISVTVNVEPLVTTLQVSVAPIVEGLPSGADAVVSPDRLDLTLAGTFDQLQGLKPTDVRAFIDVEGRGPGTYEIIPEVVVPQGVKLESASPGSVTVTLLAPTPVPTRTPTPVPTATLQATITSGVAATVTPSTTAIPNISASGTPTEGVPISPSPTAEPSATPLGAAP